MALVRRLQAGLRSYTQGPYYTRDPALARLFGMGSTASTGEVVTTDTALTLSAVWASVNLIAGSVGSLPLLLYQRDGAERVRMEQSPLYELLKERPNPEQTAVMFKETLQANLLLSGNAYAEIQRQGSGRPVALWPLEPHRVRTDRDRGGDLIYRVRPSGTGEDQILPAADVLHLRGLSWNGVDGLSVIGYARETFGAALAVRGYGAKFFRNGAVTSLVVKHPKTLTDDAYNRLRKSIEDAIGGANQHRVLILEEGLDSTPSSIPPDDAQYLESQKFSVADIARMFGVPPHMIGDVERSTSWGCVVPETKILRADGREVRADAVRPGDQLLAFEPRTGHYVAARVQAIGPTMKPLVRIRTNRGRTLEVTTDHPFWAIRTEYPTKHKEMVRSDPTWIPAGELRPGRHAVKVALNHGAGSADGESLSIAWLMGLIIGDGHITKRDGTLNITVGQVDIADRIEAIAYDQLGTTIYRRPNGGCEQIIIRKGGLGSGVEQLCARLQIRGKRAHTKQVPPSIGAASDKEVAAFLSGYLDSDGTVTTSGVVWGSVSRELVIGVQGLLARLGVQGSVRLHTPAHARHVQGQASSARAFYHLKVNSKTGVERLAALLTPIDPRKRARLAQLANRPGHRRAEGFYEYDKIVEVLPIPMRETCAIALEEPHTHITAGLVTHNTGIEQQGIGFVRYTLMRWLTRWQQECSQKLIPSLERRQQFFEFVVDGLQMADFQTRMEAHSKLHLSGLTTANRVAALENWAPFGTLGDERLIPSNMVPSDRVTDVIDAQVRPQPAPAPVADPAPDRTEAILVELRTQATQVGGLMGQSMLAYVERLETGLAAQQAELAARLEAVPKPEPVDLAPVLKAVEESTEIMVLSTAATATRLADTAEVNRVRRAAVAIVVGTLARRELDKAKAVAKDPAKAEGLATFYARRIVEDGMRLLEPLTTSATVREQLAAWAAEALVEVHDAVTAGEAEALPGRWVDRHERLTTRLVAAMEGG